MGPDDIAIQVRGLGKRYRIGGPQEKYITLRDAIVSSVRAPFRRFSADANREFWALKDISFDVEQGEVIGIIGRNGAGKSTLLKILSRITAPTEGTVDLYGRVGSLLEVGTGFHPELTGRENIFLSGSILGMRKKEIDEKFDEIVKFSEIEQFLDTPVKRYSSGMYVRLAFAVAAHLEPEILLVDEVLAVGDAGFQKKCLGKMGDVAKEGRTVLFVSHNMGAVARLCHSCILLDSGNLGLIGKTDFVIQKYLDSSFCNTSKIEYALNKECFRGQLLFIRLLNKLGFETKDFSSNENPVVEIGYILKEKIRNCHVACIVYSQDGYHVFSTADTDANPELLNTVRIPGKYVARVELPMGMLNAGRYDITVSIGIPNIEILDRQTAVSFIKHDTGDIGSLKEGGRRAGLLIIQIPWIYLPYSEVNK